MPDLEQSTDGQPVAREQGGIGIALSEVSMALVQLHKRFYGKGPVRAKSFLIDDAVVCLLEGGLTMVERTLIESGRSETVRELRREFQAAMTDEFTSVVEIALQRTVRGYMSQVHTDPDMAVELFLLEPVTETSVLSEAQRDRARRAPT